MSEENSSTQSSEDAQSSSPVAAVDDASKLLKFIESLVKEVRAEDFDKLYRLTPKGLFVERSAKDTLITHFDRWIAKETSNAADRGERKLLRRLFGTEEPRPVYLVEGKQCRAGFMALCRIPNPQNYRVAFYLGTPLLASEFLHPADPEVVSIPGCKVLQTSAGVGLAVEIGGLTYQISLQRLQQFQKLADESIQIKKHHPHLLDSLAHTAKALVDTLRRAKAVRPEDEPLRPLRCPQGRGLLECAFSAGFYFYFDKQRVLTTLYHVYGKNLYLYLRDEIGIDLAASEKRKFFGLEIFSRKDPHLGSVKLNGEKFLLSGHPFRMFVGDALENQDCLKAGKGPLTVKNYLQEFLLIFERSQPIERHKIAADRPPQMKQGYRFLVNEKWIFCINSQSEVTHCISRTSRNRQ